MDLRQLRYFVSVAREGSFSKASEKLRIAQPALSRHIQSLEYELGVDLLIRTPRGVEVTESGRKLKEKADYVLGYVAEIKSSVNELSSAPVGDVALGISPTFAFTYALRLIARVKEKHPLVNLRIVEGLSIVLYDWIDQARIDLALATDFGSFPGVDVQLVGEDEIVFVGAPRLLEGYDSGGKMHLRDIVNFPLVLTQGFHQLISPRLAEEGVEPRYEMEISSTPIVRDIVLQGGYCSIIASSVVQQDIDNGALVALGFDPHPIRRRVVTAVSSNRHVSLAIKAVDAVVREELARDGYLHQSKALEESSQD